MKNEVKLREYSHDMAAIVAAAAAVKEALIDENISRHQIKNIMEQVHQRLLRLHGLLKADLADE